MKIKRNSKCPCGSGKKFKKCCGSVVDRSRFFQASKAAEAIHRQQIEKNKTHEKTFGQVRPMISANYQGYKVVAVGNTINFSKEWKTVPDFLLDYIKNVLGSEWGLAELQKPDKEQHQIVQWHRHLCEYQKLQERGADGLFKMVPDGITNAYLVLAYDLYVLRHHQKLQEIVVRRLKDANQFQGARYELFVTATLIRAGCDIAFEDESDSVTNHPELIATHGKTRTEFDVEAKSRHRPGILGRAGDKQESEDLKTGLHRLLNRGSTKARGRPLLVLVDLNLPPDVANPLNEQWINEMRIEVARVALERNGVWPFSLAVVTNYPHHYGEFNQPDPARWAFIVKPDVSDMPHQREIANDLELALRQYGNLPTFFPDDVPQQ